MAQLEYGLADSSQLLNLVRNSCSWLKCVIKILIVFMLILHIGDGQISRSSSNIHETELGDYKLSYYLPMDKMDFSELDPEDYRERGDRILILKDNKITNHLTGSEDECIIISIVEFGGLYRESRQEDIIAATRLIIDRRATLEYTNNSYPINGGFGIMAVGNRQVGGHKVDVCAIQFYLPKSSGSTVVKQCTIISKLPREESMRLFDSFHIQR